MNWLLRPFHNFWVFSDFQLTKHCVTLLRRAAAEMDCGITLIGDQTVDDLQVIALELGLFCPFSLQSVWGWIQRKLSLVLVPILT